MRAIAVNPTFYAVSPLKTEPVLPQRTAAQSKNGGQS
jgi:hypothetical protein